MKSIRIENGVIVYYGNLVGRISNGRAVVDPMFEGPELNDFLEKQRNIREIKWLDGTFDRLTNGPRETREIQILKDCRVWQLKPDVDIRMKFIGYEELLRDFGPPDPAHYQQVFEGAVDTNDLEALYTKFNIDHPASYAGHSLSMSDVLELYDDFGSTFHYVDRFGFKQVDFEPPTPAIHHTMQL
ncbi:MAG: YodL domain-containing protein [Oscillospiraceae bacterium]|nr:YodL domain-containing protein [Oscillospiraceae bacterium]